MAKLHLEVVSPEKVVWDADVDSFVIRAADGDVGVLPGHAPLFTSLQEGVMRVRVAGEEQVLVVMGGFLQVDRDKATVLTEAAELAADIDAMRAKQAQARAEARLTEQTANMDMARAEASLKRAILRLRATELLRTNR